MYTLFDVLKTSYNIVYGFANNTGNPQNLPTWDNMNSILSNYVTSVGDHIYRSDVKARDAHTYWYDGQIAMGWIFDTKYDPIKKTAPWILTYDELPEDGRLYLIFYSTSINSIRDHIEVKPVPSMFEVTKAADIVQRCYDGYRMAADPKYFDQMWEKTFKDVNWIRDMILKTAEDSMYDGLRIPRGI